MVLTGCGSTVPWAGQNPAAEINLAFTTRNNLLFLPTVSINGTRGQFFFGTATPRTIIDTPFANKLAAGSYRLRLNNRETLNITPLALPLSGVGDALIGADVWSKFAVSIDYRTGLLTFQKDGIHADYMTLFRFEGEPAIVVNIDGQDVPAVVDTALPDTMMLPRGASPSSRAQAHLVIAGHDVGTVDVGRGDVNRARIGNRLLSKFLVSIDYGRQQVGLWRDPRIGN